MPGSERANALLKRLGYLGRASRNMLTHPIDGASRVRGRLDRRHDRKRWREAGVAPAELYRPVSDPSRALHEQLGAGVPCSCRPDFAEVWDAVARSLASTGKPVGRATYGGWNDGDAAFAEAIWSAIAHTKPDRVVETGVARGVTSRIVLEGLERNGSGRLWSVDLPGVDPALHSEIGVAVPDGLASRWRYVAGTSRRQLPRVLVEASPLDIFIHDSLHTGRNVLFEVEQAWTALRPGGVIFVDDVDHSLGLRDFLDNVEPACTLIAWHADEGGLWGAVIK